MSGEHSTDDGSWHNPLAPANYGSRTENCQFFMKTGCCRFGDRCSRSHPYPDSSCTLLLPGFYSHFSLLEGHQEEFDLDITLEYEEKETYHHFREFYMDVLPEFKELGKVVQFKVCCNYEPHLRGNVYIQYRDEDDAREAFMKFNGRWYAGKQIQCEFSVVNKWKQAICGQYKSKRCPKGKNCNFLHTFRNPGSEFWEADRDFEDLEARSERHQNWPDSERSHQSWLANRGPRRTPTWDRGRYSQRRSRSPDRYQRSKRRSRSRSLSPANNRYNRRSTTRSRRRSRSRSRKRSRSRSLSPVRSRRQRSRSPYRAKKGERWKRNSPTSRKRSRSRSPKTFKKSRSRSRSGERSRALRESRSSSRVNSSKWDSESESDSSEERRDTHQSISTTLPDETANASLSSPSLTSSKKKHKKHKKQKKHKRSKDQNGSSSPSLPKMSKDKQNDMKSVEKEGSELQTSDSPTDNTSSLLKVTCSNLQETEMSRTSQPLERTESTNGSQVELVDSAKEGTHPETDLLS